jgi:hypothetical protein
MNRKREEEDEQEEGRGRGRGKREIMFGLFLFLFFFPAQQNKRAVFLAQNFNVQSHTGSVLQGRGVL